MHEETLYSILFFPIWMYLEKLQVRKGRTEASFIHFSIILPLGWPFGGFLFISSQWKHREDTEIQVAASCFQIWDLLPSPVTNEAKNIPWCCGVGWMQWQKLIKRWFWKFTAESQSPWPIKHNWISLTEISTERDLNTELWKYMRPCQCTFLT